MKGIRVENQSNSLGVNLNLQFPNIKILKIKAIYITEQRLIIMNQIMSISKQVILSMQLSLQDVVN